MLSNKRVFGACLLLASVSFYSTTAVAIEAPDDTRGAEVAQSLVKWEWTRVPGAAHYEVTVDGVNRGITRDPQFFSGNLWPGDHSLSVRAVAEDGSFSGRTDTIKIVVNSQYKSSAANRSFVAGQARASTSSSSDTSGSVTASPSANNAGAFQAPGNPRGTEGSNRSVTWKWDAVSGAANYEVTVDGGVVGSTGDTQYTSENLWTGEHSMTVKTIDGSGSRSEQSDTAKVNVTGNASGNNQEAAVSNSVSAAPPPPSPSGGDANAANVRSMIDPSSYGYDEVKQKSGYELVFSDEFNGTALNPYRWHTQLRWDGEYNGERYEYRVVNGEDQFYVNIFSSDQDHLNKIVPQHNPFEFDGSRLAIRAKKNPLKKNNGKRTYGSLDEMSSQQTFLSGAIATHNKFSQKYGYFEARIKIPGHVGAFPAFWLFHDKRAWEGTKRSEIDIMENLGHAPWYIYNSFHYFDNVSTSYSGDANFLKPAPSGQVYTGTDYSQDFHTYAVEWKPNRVTWYIDGQQVSVLDSDKVNFEDLYVKLNLAMGGNWTNFPANSGGLGRSSDQRYPTQDDLNSFSDPALEIDYVRVYKRK